MNLNRVLLENRSKTSSGGQRAPCEMLVERRLVHVAFLPLKKIASSSSPSFLQPELFAALVDVLSVADDASFQKVAPSSSVKAFVSVVYVVYLYSDVSFILVFFAFE
jgi:hypothetical protein